MSYLNLILAFERWLETNYLQSSVQLLWYKLISLFNKAGWREWIGVDNHRLMVMMQIKREATFIELRNKLLEAKLFEFKRGKKGQPNQYKICTYVFESLYSSKKENTYENESQNSSTNSSTNSSQNRSRNRRHI